jgi:hypothetical protein
MHTQALGDHPDKLLGIGGAISQLRSSSQVSITRFISSSRDFSASNVRRVPMGCT